MTTDELIQRFLEGRASLSEASELSDLIERDPHARSRYLDIAELHAALMADETLRQEIPPQQVARKPQRHWTQITLKIAAIAAVLFGLASLISPKPASPRPMAKLLSTENAHWGDSSTELTLNAGQAPTSILRLVQGKAEFVTALGAVVMLQAPVVMRFESATSLFVESGKVLCNCPTPESRLEVRTRQTSVVDLGTEFVVEARADESTRVAVLSGEVKVSSTVLHKGQAAEVRARGLTMLRSEVVNEMRPHFATASVSLSSNLLSNADFSALKKNWYTESPHSEIAEGELHIRSSEGHYWPNARQTVWQSPKGKAVTVSIRAKQAANDPLSPNQFAVLKLVFIGEGGRQIAYASRHFQFGGEEAGVFQKASITAISPPGSKAVRLELLLNACSEPHGSVIFDDAALSFDEISRSL
jgi:hypothetical protein